MTRRILSIGAATQDILLQGGEAFKPWHHKGVEYERLPLGSKLEVENMTFTTGGGACNAAVTFARQGLHSMFMGTIADDPAGHAVLKALDDDDADTTYVSYDEKYGTGYSTILLAPNGERTVMVYRGASSHYQQKNFNLKNTKADWIYLSSMAGKMEVVEYIVSQAAREGIKVAWNPGSGELKQPAKVKSLLEDIEVLVLNKEEMQLLVEGGTAEELARHALHYVPTVIVSDGPHGAVAANSEKLVRAGMYEDVKVIDRLGAGDAFGSGFVARIAVGRSLEEAVTFASANSTSVVTKIGAKAGILHANAHIHDMPLETKSL